MTIRQRGFAGGLALLIHWYSFGQFGPLKATLKPQTITAFASYAEQVEGQLKQRWSGKRAFLQLDDDPAEKRKVLSGDLWVEPDLQPNPRAIPDGLIHDWYGAVYIPKSDVGRVLKVLQDFNHHAAIYPQVIKSHLIRRDGNAFTGYWRIEQKGQVLPAVFDVVQTARYNEIAPGKWEGVSHADDIQAVEAEGSSREKTLPAGEGMGLMWKLYSYWSLEQVGDGVLAECRTVSLSRGIPASVAWMIRPFINTIPRDSMQSTLENTRKASGE